MSRAGLIRKISGRGNRIRYDGNREEHCHLRCAGCGRLVDLPEERISVPGSLSQDAKGWEITGYRVEYADLLLACASG